MATPYTVPAVERALTIIDALERSSLGLTKTDIANRLGLPYSSVFNLLNTLEAHGYARRDHDTNRYYLGPRMVHGERLLADEGALRRAGVPVMRRLIERTSMTCHLAVLRGGDAVYIEKQEPPGFLRLNTWVGQRIYVHSSAVGKALVCELPKAEVDAIWRRRLPRRTANTVTSFRAFWKELKKTAERGYAIDDQEDQIGGRCIAAPVRSGNGAIIAALGLSGVAEHLPSSEFERWGRAVRSATHEISVDRS